MEVIGGAGLGAPAGLGSHEERMSTADAVRSATA
jgi:hypothetical protein